MDIFTLKRGVIEKLSSVDKITKRGVTWIRAINPNSFEVKDLTELIDANTNQFDEFLVEDERPRIYSNGHLQVIFRTPLVEDENEVTTTPISFFIKGNIVITLEKSPTFALDGVSSDLESNHKKYMISHTGMYFVGCVLSQINQEFLKHIKHVEYSSELFKSKITQLSEAHIQKVYDATITSTFFEPALKANIEVLAQLKKSNFKQLTPKDHQKLSGIYFDALQNYDAHKIQKEVLMNLFDIQSVVNSAHMNTLMKKISTVALVIMVPTLITGIYGMNIVSMPLLNHPNGFLLISGIMVLTTLISYGIFKFQKWL